MDSATAWNCFPGLLPQRVQDAGLRRDYELVCAGFLRMPQHPARRQNVRLVHGVVDCRGQVHGRRGASALGMHQEVRLRVALPGPSNLNRLHGGVHVTFPQPDRDVRAARHLLDVVAEEHVRQEEHFLFPRDGVDDLDRVRGCAAVVALRLYFSGRIDVGHDHGARMVRFPRAEVVRRDRGRQRAAGFQVRNQHALPRRQHGGSLRHEVHAAENDDVGVCLRGLPGEPQRIADVVRDVLNLRELVVVGKDDRVALHP